MDIQIVTYDSYQSPPTELDKSFVTINNEKIPAIKNLKFKNIPILRVYGKVITGHTCLLHIHDVFPYLYINFPLALNWNSNNLSSNNKSELIRWLLELNSALKNSFKKNSKFKRKKTNKKNIYENCNHKDDDNDDYDDDNNNNDFNSDLESDVDYEIEDSEDLSNSNYSYISDISIVKGIPFYGYHLQQSTFLKISLTSPKYITRLSKLLTDSKIFNKFIQPYESHIPFTLQFLIDYNCYTLKNINTSKYLWRNPLILIKDNDDTNYNINSKNNNSLLFHPYFKTNFTYFNNQKINNDLKLFIKDHIYSIDNNFNILNPDLFPRISRSMLEFDILSNWILNRNSLNERNVTQLNNSINSNDDENSILSLVNTQYITSTKSLLDDVENLRQSRGLKIDNSQLGLFDNIPRKNNPIIWNDQSELDKLFKNALNLSNDSYLKKFKDKTFNKLKNLKDHSNLSNFPSSFQSIDKLHYFPILSNNLLLNEKIIDNQGIYGIDDNTIFDKLISFSTSFTSSLENHQNIDPSPLDEDLHLKLDNIDNDDNSNNDEKDDDDDDNNEYINNHSNNLSLKLYDASTIDPKSPISFNGSDLSFLNSTQEKKLSKNSFTFSQREKLVKDEVFSNYFQDSDSLEFIYTFNIQQPCSISKDDFLNSLQNDYNLLKIDYPNPFYSKLSNYDSKPFIFAGEKFKIDCSEIDTELYPFGNQLSIFSKNSNDSFLWRYSPKLPSFDDVKLFTEKNIEDQITDSSDPPSFIFNSQIKGPTQNYKGFKYPSIKTPIEKTSNTDLTQIILIIEIHVNTRSDKLPDPELDEIVAIFWKVNIDDFKYKIDLPESGIFINSNFNKKCDAISNELNKFISCYPTETDLIIALVSLVEMLDPDILAGFELHSLSWGYIIERFKFKYQIDLCQRLSRVVYKHNNKVGDRWGYTHASGIKITGRQFLNLWRRLRSELNLNHYSLENILFHVFHVRTPNFPWKILTAWWKSNNIKYLSYVLNYYNTRVQYEMDLIKKLEIIEKINEQSRLLGIDFYSMIYRGSQFKVECLLVRLAKAENFMLISPSKKQVFKQDSLDCIPLVMEPNSAFYKSPLVVLDFQSLYPSIIIAYNICYSTLLGRLKNYDPTKYTKLGVTNYKSPEGILKFLEKDIKVTPNGAMFVKQNIRRSLLSKMLIEILNARTYIKNTMDEFKDDYELQKLYNNRQLALKLIANVTYGYTSASYSGRMPNSDIADAIVSCGRETLLKAVKEIEKNDKWGAKVVYGDTDSLFVYLPGKTKDDAFKIGKEMASHITSLNPEPVKLKFEKVYLPSVLVSKKRYVGFKYEYESQKFPKFDAKGIETVRRDGIPAQQKILEKALTLLFKTRDVSQVKDFIIEQFVKIVKGKINIQDFLFAKEVRLGTYKNEKYIPPGARLSMKKIEKDHRLEPQYRERIFYIVRKGHNKEILRDRCVSPNDFLNNSSMELDSDYYINKVLVPPLERIFNLLGIDIKSWIKEIPQGLSYSGIGVKLLNIKLATCLCCGKKTKLNLNLNSKNEEVFSLCDDCKKKELKTLMILNKRIRIQEQKAMNYINFCSSCSAKSVGEQVKDDVATSCCNVDCGVYYSRVKTLNATNNLMDEYQEIPDW